MQYFGNLQRTHSSVVTMGFGRINRHMWVLASCWLNTLKLFAVLHWA